MTWLAGVDGCRKGWFRAARETRTGALDFRIVEDAADLARIAPQPAVIALDIPIGLPSAGVRACDREARARLGPRRSSVFAAPIRAALAARTQSEASDITERADGRRVAAQAFGIYAKVRQVDAALARDAALRSLVREVHPELSFCAWNGGAPLRFAKKTREGGRERVALVHSWLGDGILERARAGQRRADLADDDILDALAALWTAHRIAAGTAQTLPARPVRDALDLPMEIVF